jgi:glycopeptide antibiotics resistance protein
MAAAVGVFLGLVDLGFARIMDLILNAGGSVESNI